MIFFAVFPPHILGVWNTYGRYAMYLSLIGSAVVFLSYEVRLLFARDFKKRYDMVSQYEITYLWYSFLLLIFGGILYVNTSFSETIWVSFLVRWVVSIVLSISIGMLAQYALKFYYPFYVERRLRRLRYLPRISPDGRKMKLLTEEEEDIFLDEGMQEEENLYSIDYDVWVDEVSGFFKIERYHGRMHAMRCPECKYMTMRLTRDEMLTSPSMQDSGRIKKYYLCSYCGYEQNQAYDIGRLSGGKGV